MSKKILISLSIFLIILANVSMCFASNLQIVQKEITVDYKNADEQYNNISKTLVEDKIYYELEKIDRKDNLKTLTKDKEIVEELEVDNNNLEKIIDMFNNTKD